MRPNGKHDCCQPLVAALRDARGAVGPGLVVRADEHGALYFKLTAGDREFSEAHVNEPASFCPFCGRPVSAAAAPAPRREDPPEEDEELTVLACAPTLVGVAA